MLNPFPCYPHRLQEFFPLAVKVKPGLLVHKFCFLTTIINRIAGGGQIPCCSEGICAGGEEESYIKHQPPVTRDADRSEDIDL